MEATTAERQKKKAEMALQKQLAPIQLSNYKYEAPDIEVKLSDELTGNLRTLKPEGSLLVDRYNLNSLRKAFLLFDILNAI